MIRRPMLPVRWPHIAVRKRTVEPATVITEIQLTIPLFPRLITRIPSYQNRTQTFFRASGRTVAAERRTGERAWKLCYRISASRCDSWHLTRICCSSKHQFSHFRHCHPCGCRRDSDLTELSLFASLASPLLNAPESVSCDGAYAEDEICAILK